MTFATFICTSATRVALVATIAPGGTRARPSVGVDLRLDQCSLRPPKGSWRHRNALATPSLGEWLAPLSVCVAFSVAYFDALPAKQARIERPGAGTKQRKCCGERCEQHVEAHVSWVEEPLQHRVDRRERTNDRRP